MSEYDEVRGNVVCRWNGTDSLRVISGVSSLLRNGGVVGDVIDKISKFLGISPQSDVESAPAAHELGHEVEDGTWNQRAERMVSGNRLRDMNDGTYEFLPTLKLNERE